MPKQKVENIATLLQMEWLESTDPNRPAGFRSLVELNGLDARTARDGVAVLDAQGNLLYASSVFCQLHGLRQDQVLSANVNLLYGAEAGRELVAKMSRLARESLAYWRGQFRRHDGEVIPLEASVIALTLQQPQPDHFVLLVRAGSVANQAALQSEEGSFEERSRLFARALDFISEAILITSPDGEILYANRAVSHVFKTETAKLLGKSLLDLVAASERYMVAQALEDLANHDHWIEELPLVKSGGRKFAACLEIVAERGARSLPRFLLVACTDLSEKRLLETNLRQAQKLEAVGLLASGLAHNINSPLAAIMVTAEMAQAKCPQMREFSDILQAADRIHEIVANLMTKSRQEQSTEVVEIDVNQLVKTELKFLEANLFFKHQVSLVVKQAPLLPKIRGLYSDFSQCFYNLVQNALDAMSEVEQRTMTVTTGFTEDQKAIFLSVQDTGCGIPEKHLGRIFKPFFTTKPEVNHETDEARPSGTGLGLSTTNHLMEKYGAIIEVRSQVGIGSEFLVTIPLSAPDPSVTKKKRTVKSAARS